MGGRSIDRISGSSFFLFRPGLDRPVQPHDHWLRRPAERFKDFFKSFDPNPPEAFFDEVRNS
jgi:hypothetical protein